MNGNRHSTLSGRLTGLLLLLALGVHGLVHAANPLYSAAVATNDGNSGVTIGMEFTPVADIQVTQLGVFDGGSDGAGLQTSHDVGLWQSNGTPVTSVTVTAASALTSGFRYEAITPVTLSAGQTYVLGTYYSMAGDKLQVLQSDPAPVATPFVTLGTTSLLEGGTGLMFPTAVTSTDFRITANLLFVPVDTSPMNINGTVKTTLGADINAMVLASGQYLFSNNPKGVYALSNLPRQTDGTVKLQVYASGFLPYKSSLATSGTYPVTLTRAGTCPNYNAPGNPSVNPGSAGNWVDVSGSVLRQNTQTPVCAMVLANGQYMFSCGANLGIYNLHVPLDTNGQVKLQVYADGFAPYNIKIDEYQTVNDTRLARASECQ